MYGTIQKYIYKTLTLRLSRPIRESRWGVHQGFVLSGRGMYNIIWRHCVRSNNLSRTKDM